MSPVRIENPQSEIQNPFTLIELLVVVAIIAVLASMLLPALVQARKTAKQAACTNRLKQVILAVENYRDDNDDYYPPDALTAGACVPGSHYFAAKIVPYLGITTTLRQHSISQNLLWCPDSGYLPSPSHSSAVICESGYNSGWSQVGNYWISAFFGLNQWGGTVDNGPTQWCQRKAIINRPANIIMIGEIYSAGWTRFGQYRYTRYFINPHNYKTQIGFADGHVGTMPVLVRGSNPDPRQFGIDFWD